MEFIPQLAVNSRKLWLLVLYEDAKKSFPNQQIN